MQDLGTLGGAWSQAYVINSNGQVVGQAATAEGSGHAFLYNGQMEDLNDLIEQDSGWTLNEADGINDLGQIVCSGINSSGQSDLFLLTPVPEPSTLVLLGISVISLLAYGWRRRAT